MSDLFLQVNVLLIWNVRILVSSLQIIQLVTKAVDCKTVARTTSDNVKVGFSFPSKLYLLRLQQILIKLLEFQ